MKSAVCPGSYDPVTNGHIDIFRRAAKQFDKLCICVTENGGKDCLFSAEERAELIRRVTADIPGVTVDTFSGLIARYAEENGYDVIVKGLRSSDDFEMEYTMSVYNKRIAPGVETIYLPAAENNLFLSSSAVRELAYFGYELHGYVPDEIISDIMIRTNEKRRRR